MDKLIFLIVILPLQMLQSQELEAIISKDLDSTFYFSSCDYPVQTARIELDQPITLKSIEISLDGGYSGKFDLDIYGHEGGASRPVMKQEKMKTKTLTKDCSGFQIIELVLEKPLKFVNDYLFIYTIK